MQVLFGPTGPITLVFSGWIINWSKNGRVSVLIAGQYLFLGQQFELGPLPHEYFP
jgi:hypothetical protein